MKRLGQAILVYVIGNLIFDVSLRAMNNVIEGKDILGNKIEKDKYRVDMLKRIHLGREEYRVV